MGWLGKVLIGTIGYAMGGPLGAIGGAAIGHLLDADHGKGRVPCPHCGKRLKVPEGGRWKCPHCQGQFDFPGRSSAKINANEQAQYVFFVALFSMLAKLAKADGTVSPAEIQVVEECMRKQLKLDADSRKVAQRIFNEAKDSDYRFEDFARQFHQLFRHDQGMLREMLDLLVRVSMADGQMHPEEERLVNIATEIFGLGEHEYRRARTSHGVDFARHYAVLGAEPSDSDAEIKKKYRKKVAEFHPDKIVSKGLPEEFTKFANQKVQELNQAYKAIRERRSARS